MISSSTAKTLLSDKNKNEKHKQNIPSNSLLNLRICEKFVIHTFPIVEL